MPEAAFFVQRHLRDMLIMVGNVAVFVFHGVHDDLNPFMQERLGHAEQLAVPGGAAHNPAQHVAAPLIRGQHAVAD